MWLRKYKEQLNDETAINQMKIIIFLWLCNKIMLSVGNKIN